MRIALVRPLCSYDEPEFQEPLGAEAVCGYLRERGLECRVFDRLLGVTTADLAAYEPDWVGFSLLTDADVPDALRLVQMLRAPGRRFFSGHPCPCRGSDCIMGSAKDHRTGGSIS